MIHRRTHPVFVEGCRQCRWASVGVSAEALPTRHPRAVEVIETEKRWDVDMPAYKRMRRQGHQPRAIDGCAQLEKHATHEVELERGKLINNKSVKDRMTEGTQISKELGFI
jgi:hypothetical protein